MKTNKKNQNTEDKVSYKKVDRKMMNKRKRIIDNNLPVYEKKLALIHCPKAGKVIEKPIIDRDRPISWTPVTIEKWIEEYQAKTLKASDEGIKNQRKKNKTTNRKKVHYSDLAANLDRDERKEIS